MGEEYVHEEAGGSACAVPRLSGDWGVGRRQQG